MIDPDFHLPNTPSPAVPAQPYLDPQNQAFIDAGIKAGGPSLESLSYTAAREVLEGLQAHTPSSDVTREELSILVGATSSLVKTYLYKPASTKEVKVLPTIFYFHGGGWILGSPHTHDSLVRDLVRQTGAAVVFPKYTPAPEGKFPKVFEEVYGVVESIVKRGAKHDLAISKIAFAGDSVGGHMAIAMSILAAQRKLPAKIVYQALFYPVTDTSHESTTYTTYANGPYLTPSLLHWMYAAFFPTSPSESTQARCTNLGSPLRMTKEKAAQQPSTLIVVAGADPLQEEGKLFGHLLQSAGVETAVLQADGQVHDFVMLEPTRGSETARAVVELASFKLKKALALA